MRMLLVLACAAAQGSASERLEALAGRAATELAAVGCELELEGLSFAVRPREECVRDVEEQLALFYPPSYYPAMRVLYRGLGLALGRDDAETRTGIARAMLGGLAAYYQAARRELVLVGDERAAFSPAALELVRHELVHAWRDARSSLAVLFAAPRQTLEAARIALCLSEGEAEALALCAATLAGGGTPEDAWSAERDDPLARLLAGEALSLPYTVGRRHALGLLRAGGLAALDAAWRERPRSSEELLHPVKRGLDLPSEVQLDALAGEGLSLRHEDVVGEMTLLGLLLERGAEREQAWLAALGWDGDRLSLLARGEGEGELLGLAWRSVWDREEDAEQLEALWRSLSKGRTTRRGRVVDWAFSEDEALERELAARLARSPFALEAQARTLDDGAASTAALEHERLARERPRLEDGWWIVPAAGLRLRAPDGWSAREIGGLPFLMAPQRDGFADNANALVQPNPPGASLEETLEAYLLGLRAAGLEPGLARERELDGRRVLQLEAHGQVGPNQLAFVVLLSPRERERVELTITVLAARAEELAPAVEVALASLRWD